MINFHMCYKLLPSLVNFSTCACKIQKVHLCRLENGSTDGRSSLVELPAEVALSLTIECCMLDRPPDLINSDAVFVNAFFSSTF